MHLNTNHEVAADVTGYLYESGIPVTHIDTLRERLSALPTISYNDAIREAAGLLEPGELGGNPEYERGMRELIARLFGDSILGTEGDTSIGQGFVDEDITEAVMA